MKMADIWDVAVCSLVDHGQCFTVLTASIALMMKAVTCHKNLKSHSEYIEWLILCPISKCPEH
jgi:hypothetical protein